MFLCRIFIRQASSFPKKNRMRIIYITYCFIQIKINNNFPLNGIPLKFLYEYSFQSVLRLKPSAMTPCSGPQVSRLKPEPHAANGLRRYRRKGRRGAPGRQRQTRQSISLMKCSTSVGQGETEAAASEQPQVNCGCSDGGVKPRVSTEGSGRQIFSMAKRSTDKESRDESRFAQAPEHPGGAFAKRKCPGGN